MALAKIKEEFKSTLVVFNGGGKKLLGERDDIDVLAIMAHESQNQSLIKLFEVLPPLDELKKARLDGELKKSDAVPEVRQTVEPPIVKEPIAIEPPAEVKEKIDKKNHAK